MLSSIYIYFWILAFQGFMVFLLSFLIARKNGIVNIASVLSALSVGWVFSALALRLGIGPSPLTWFNISVIFLLIIPYFLYFLIVLEANESLFTARTVILACICLLQLFLALEERYFKPVFIMRPDTANNLSVGSLVDVVKNPELPAVLLVLGPLILVGYGIRILHEHKNMEHRILLGIGMLSYLILNFLYVYGKSHFPYELAAGIINGLIFMYVIRNRRILNFDRRLPHIAFPLFAVLIVHLFCILPYYRSWGAMEPFKQEVMNIIFLISFMTSFNVIFFEFLFSKFFFEKNDHILKSNSRYHDELLPRYGRIDEIADLFIQTLINTYEIRHLVLYLRNEDERSYMAYGPDSYGRKAFAEDEEIVEHTVNLDVPQSAWNVLKYVGSENSELAKAIENRELAVFSPISLDSKVIGFYFMGGGKITNIDNLDKAYLISMNKTTAMAIESSHMMNTLHRAAVTDPLTGLYDRNATESILVKYKDSGEPFILLLFNIDDMKLFNLVYSIGEGDKLISVFADMLRKEADEKVTLGRISGKTFSALIKGSIEEAIDYDSRVRTSFSLANRGTMRSDITFSTGLLPVKENDGRSAEEILDDVKRASVQAKREGKNKLFIYRDYMRDQPYRYDPGVRVETVDAIAKALNLRDHLTYEHSYNVAEYARILASAIGIDPLTVHVIYEAGLVHDIGKISIPDSVLLNTGKLRDDEYEIMKSHVERGRDVIESLPFGFRMAPIAMSHHERWDGKGYPAGLKGEEIPIGGRCLAIADTFDAMTSNRIYRKARSIDEALEEILRASGTQLDPELGPLFVRLVREGRIEPHPSL